MITDGQLLKRYVSEGDPVAFRDLVVRHGPTVLKVCRCVLRDLGEVEDAFQGTFLVLVRKAPSIRDPERLGNWLHGVAFRVASKARRRALRRRERERRRAEMFPDRRSKEPTWDDLAGVLREELDRLPEGYRAPLELCYLRGLTHEQAALELGWPLGTVKVRLTRGRRRIRERLERRGLGLGLLLLLMLGREGEAAVPEALLESTVEAMNLQVGGESALLAGRFPRASSLADSAIRGRSLGRWVLGLSALLGLFLGGLGLALTADDPGPRHLAEAMDLPPSLTDVLNVDCR